jgi:hypothetical protein
MSGSRTANTALASARSTSAASEGRSRAASGRKALGLGVGLVVSFVMLRER